MASWKIQKVGVLNMLGGETQDLIEWTSYQMLSCHTCVPGG